MTKGTIKGWTGDLAILEHLDKYGVLDRASDMADDEDPIGPGMTGAELRERYRT